MARITFDIDAARAAKVHDARSEAYPDDRHAWIDLTDRNGSVLTLSMSYGVSTDAEIVAGGSLLIAAVRELVTAAQGRIRDREWIAAAKASRTATEAALADGLEAATLADALKGMAPGEIVEAFGR